MQMFCWQSASCSLQQKSFMDFIKLGTKWKQCRLRIEDVNIFSNKRMCILGKYFQYLSLWFEANWANSCRTVPWDSPISHRTCYSKISQRLGGAGVGAYSLPIALKLGHCLGISASTISKRYEHFKIQSHGLETWRDLTSLDIGTVPWAFPSISGCWVPCLLAGQLCSGLQECVLTPGHWASCLLWRTLVLHDPNTGDENNRTCDVRINCVHVRP